eukprot:scaffold126650_cov33-Tisochrysis_lutea.AAC.6
MRSSTIGAKPGMAQLSSRTVLDVVTLHRWRSSALAARKSPPSSRSMASLASSPSVTLVGCRPGDQLTPISAMARNNMSGKMRRTSYHESVEVVAAA